ncbi:MAG TPA: acyl-CoA dehydrogenase family protein [Pyrinomonadaceae bacterium]|jgi:alkylation response protein AidB-like acyl-CoA dehydrogenase|nr:acyl-CoA dehydrogenase family protein [Pyrinomonadaceae bacterium]
MTQSAKTDLDQLLSKIRSFLREEVYPLERSFLRQPFRELLPTLQAKRDQVKAAGMWTPHLAEEHGGLGLSLSEFALVSEELGRTPLGHYLFNCQAPDIGNTEILITHGTPAQKERYLLPLLRGEIRSCFSMTEPEHPGSNPTWLSTTAEKDGEDYVINGHKWFTSSADGASFAIVMAVTNPDSASRYEKASQIIVPIPTEGFEIVRNINVMGEDGSDYASHAEVRYTNCRVPRANLLGGEGKGFQIAQERLGPGRIHHCMRWIGICERAFDLMCEYSASRELAPGVFLGSKQNVQEWIAESRAEIDSARLLVLDTASKIDRHGASSSRSEISLIKFYVAGILQKVVDRAIQVHGALGLTDATLLSYWYRHERGARIYDGPDEVHKTVVAKAALRRYGMNL